MPAKTPLQHRTRGRVGSLVRIKQDHDTIELQAAELAELNTNLEARVADQVEELERLGRLRRVLSRTLADLVLSQGESILESHRREIAVLFADLRGWTVFSVSTEPEEVMGVIREFHDAMGELILRFEATVGWFAGDGLMVWFNDPIPCPDPAVRAASMAAAMQATMTVRRGGGVAAVTSSTFRWGSRWDTQRSEGSASTVDTITAPSDP